MANIQTVIDALQDAEADEFDRIKITDKARCAMVRILMKEAELLKEQPHWISVKERMPEKEGFYLVSAEHGNFIPWIAEMRIFMGIKGFCSPAAQPVVGAWMPLPEPYRTNI